MYNYIYIYIYIYIYMTTELVLTEAHSVYVKTSVHSFSGSKFFI